MKKHAISLVATGERFDASSAITEIRGRMLLSVEEAAIRLGRTEEALRNAIERRELFAWRQAGLPESSRSDAAVATPAAVPVL